MSMTGEAQQSELLRLVEDVVSFNAYLSTFIMIVRLKSHNHNKNCFITFSINTSKMYKIFRIILLIIVWGLAAE